LTDTSDCPIWYRETKEVFDAEEESQTESRAEAREAETRTQGRTEAGEEESRTETALRSEDPGREALQTHGGRQLEVLFSASLIDTPLSGLVGAWL
jgi:hypothetical protein